MFFIDLVSHTPQFAVFFSRRMRRNRRMPKNRSLRATQNQLHIGQLIKAVFDESGMSISEFARQIHLERTTVYNIFERQSIDTMLLARVSLALKHNFLTDVEKHYGLIPQSPSITLHLDNLSLETVLQLTELLNTVSVS